MLEMGKSLSVLMRHLNSFDCFLSEMFPHGLNYSRLAIVSQPSKCLKIQDFSGGMFCQIQLNAST